MTRLRGFPHRTLSAKDTLYRIHESIHNANHYSKSGQNRFDAPPGHSPRYGVCYTALAAIGAYIEVFGRSGFSTPAQLAEYCLSAATPSRSLRVADLTDRTILGRYNIAADISTGTDYGASQQVSAELHAEGFDGIFYRARHDPQVRLECVALFDTSTAVKAGLNWSTPTDISDALVEQGLEFAIEVTGLTKLP